MSTFASTTCISRETLTYLHKYHLVTIKLTLKLLKFTSSICGYHEQHSDQHSVRNQWAPHNMTRWCSVLSWLCRYTVVAYQGILYSGPQNISLAVWLGDLPTLLLQPWWMGTWRWLWRTVEPFVLCSEKGKGIKVELGKNPEGKRHLTTIKQVSCG